MVFSHQTSTCQKQSALPRLVWSLLLAITILCGVSGCSALSLHRSQQEEQLPTNPWIKPAKPETMGQKFKGLFWKEKKFDSPKDWLGQKRPE
jgi:hypothetical protein